MNQIKRFLFVVLLLTSTQSNAQFNRYLIGFDRKTPNNFSISQPSSFLSVKAIERRTNQQLALDSTDLPIISRYLDSLKNIPGVEILSISKWLNQVAVSVNSLSTLQQIQNLAFVRQVNPIASRNSININQKFQTENNSIDDFNRNVETTNNASELAYGSSRAQTYIHHGEFLHNHGLRGNGMNIAVLDAGFFNYDNLITFDSLRNKGQILDTWDFVARDSVVADDDYHGTHCFSTIAANMPGVFVGTSPESNFFLYRSEDVSSEYPIEENHLAAALERADSAGVDLCSISLGYSTFDDPLFNYTYANMDGNTSISAKAVDLAAKKGMMMVVAAGNEGQRAWRYIITPGDADSCLTVGAVDSLGMVAGFSSIGPSSDGNIKPNVSAIGRNAIVANAVTGRPQFGSGTSYATPILAGLVSCLWQAFPEASNMKIIDVIQQHASRSDAPNITMGYGIPDVKKSFVSLQKYFSSHQTMFRNCAIEHDLNIVADSTMKITIERKDPDGNYFLVHEWQNQGKISKQNFRHNESLNGTNFSFIQYRYTMTISGDTSYVIDSLTIFPANPCDIILPTNNKFIISPNPAKDFIRIKWERATNANVEMMLYNASGQKIYKTSSQIEPGFYEKSLPNKPLSPGVYFLHIIINGEKPRIEKVVVL
jgi:hypothetical protein